MPWIVTVKFLAPPSRFGGGRLSISYRCRDLLSPGFETPLEKLRRPENFTLAEAMGLDPERDWETQDPSTLPARLQKVAEAEEFEMRSEASDGPAALAEGLQRTRDLLASTELGPFLRLNEHVSLHAHPDGDRFSPHGVREFCNLTPDGTLIAQEPAKPVARLQHTCPWCEREVDGHRLDSQVAGEDHAFVFYRCPECAQRFREECRVGYASEFERA